MNCEVNKGHFLPFVCGPEQVIISLHQGLVFFSSSWNFTPHLIKFMSAFLCISELDLFFIMWDWTIVDITKWPPRSQRAINESWPRRCRLWSVTVHCNQSQRVLVSSYYFNSSVHAHVLSLRRWKLALNHCSIKDLLTCVSLEWSERDFWLKHEREHVPSHCELALRFKKKI